MWSRKRCNHDWRIDILQLILAILLTARAAMRARARQIMLSGGWAAYVLPPVTVCGLLLLLLLPAYRVVPPVVLRGGAARIGQAAWLGWVLIALILRDGFSWRIDLRQHVADAGFRAAFLVATALCLFSGVLMAAFVCVLVLAEFFWRPAYLNAVALPIALVLLLLLTLRFLSILLILTKRSRQSSVRGIAYLMGALPFVWALSGRKIPVLGWFGTALDGSASEVLRSILCLLVTALVLAIADALLTHWDFSQGEFEPQRRIFGAYFLASGAPESMSWRTAILGWPRNPGFALLFVWGLIYPCGYLFFSGVRISLGSVVLYSVLPFLFLSHIRGNLLGIDHGGAWQYAAAGVSPYDVLWKRSIALAVIQMIMAGPVLVLTIWRSADLLTIIGLVCFDCLAVLITVVVGLAVSVRFARPIVRSDYRSGASAPGAFAVSLALGAGMLLYFAGWAMWRKQHSPALWIFFAGIVIVSIGLRRVFQRLESYRAWQEELFSLLGVL